MEPQPIIEPKKASALPIVILTILLVFSLGFSGFLYYQTTLLQKQINTLTTSNNQNITSKEWLMVPTTSPQKTTNDMNSWVTLTSPYLKYSFKLPPVWKVIDHSSKFQEYESYEATTGEKIDISLVAISPLECKGDCPVISKQTPTTFAGQTATKIEGYVGSIGGNNPHEYITITTKHQNQNLNITYNPSIKGKSTTTETVPLTESDKNLFNQILSTFILSSSTSSTTSNYNQVQTIVLNNNWVERGIPINQDSIREIDSTDHCRDIIISKVGNSANLINFIKSYYKLNNDIPVFSTQYTLGSYSTKTLPAMNAEEISNTFTQVGNSIYLIQVNVTSQNNPPLCKTSYDNDLKAIIESIRFKAD